MKLNEVFAPLNEDVGTAQRLLKQYDTEIQKYYSQNKYVYRGVKSEELALLVDGKTLDRVASETFNFVNLMVSEMLPEWKKYPPRNKSIICAMSSNHARSYGNVYHVIPLEGQEFGVCPVSDFWGSFPVLVNVLNESLLLLGGYKPTDPIAHTKNPQDVLDLCNRCDRNMKNGDIDYHISTVRSYNIKEHLEKLRDSGLTTFEFCRQSLNPDSNGFKLSSFANLKDDTEVWLTGKVLMIDAKLALRNYIK